MNLCTRMISLSICVDRELACVRSLYSGLSSIAPTLVVLSSSGTDWKWAIFCAVGGDVRSALLEM